jgi:uncharacterized membrane protein
MRVVLLIGWLLIGLVACQSDDESSGTAGDSAGDGDGDSGTSGGGETCNVTAPTACPSDMPTYADVEPIFQERCVACHVGLGQSELCPTCWELTDYSHVASWKQEIKTAMLACDMPPPESGMTMTDSERMTILEWIRCGTPE